MLLLIFDITVLVILITALPTIKRLVRVVLIKKYNKYVDTIIEENNKNSKEINEYAYHRTTDICEFSRFPCWYMYKGMLVEEYDCKCGHKKILITQKHMDQIYIRQLSYDEWLISYLTFGSL